MPTPSAWVLLAMCFISGLATGGAPPPDVPGNWMFVGNQWSHKNSRLVQTNPLGRPQAVWRNQAYSDCSVQVRFRVGNDGNGVKAAGLLLRSRDSRCAYFVHYDTKNNQIILSRVGIDGKRREIIRKVGIRLDTGRWYEARTDISGDVLRVYLDGREMLSGEDPGGMAAGFPGLYTSQGKIEFEDFKVTGTPADSPTEWRIRMSYEVEPDQAVATILDTRVICKEPGRYVGWPTVCRRRNGELLAVFSGDRDQHVCPWGKVELVRSADNGQTWSAPVSICNTPLDDRDAGIIETAKGTLVVAWFTSLAFENALKGSWLKGLESADVRNQWRLHAEKLTPTIREQWLGHWTQRSEDGGKTWDTPTRTRGSAPHGPVELADGRLLYVGRCFPHAATELTVEESKNDGRSWERIALIQVSPDDNISEFHEPHVVEAANGTLIAVFRYHYIDPKTKKRIGLKDYMRQSVSTDGGRTWTVAETTPMLGYPPHLIRLRNNAIVCVYGRRSAPYGEYACVSWDNGQTWDVDNEIKLAAALSGDLGYPASTELEDGSIYTVYYQIHESGEKTSLLGTHWRLKER